MAWRSQFKVLATATSVVAIGTVPGFMIASLAPEINRDFSMTDAELGVVVSVFYASCAIASQTVGVFARRMSSADLLKLSALGTSIGCLLIGLWVHSSLSAAAVLVLAGFANGIAGPAASSVVRSGISNRRRGTAMGLQMSGASLGALASGAAVPLFALTIGWRWAFLAAAAFALVAGILVPRSTAVRDTPKSSQRESVSVPILLITLAAFLSTAASTALVSFFVTFSDDAGLHTGMAGIGVLLIGLIASLGRVSFGRLADQDPKLSMRVLALVMGLSGVGFLLLTSGAPALLVIGGLLAAVGWTWQGAVVLVLTELRPMEPAKTVGIMMTGLFAGAITGPALVGVLAEVSSFQIGWAICATFVVLGALALFGAEKRIAPKYEGGGQESL